jgi:ATP-dependent protease ClpP protease subunit
MAKKTYTLDIDGYIGYWTASKKYIKQVLSQAPQGEILVRVNSLGGDLDHGIDIAAQFEAHGNVICEIFSLNASAATILTLGAAKVRAHQDASYLIHKPLAWIDAWGHMNEDDLENTIEQLKRDKDNAATQTLITARMYSRKTGKPVKNILSLMKEEKWLSAEQALQWGFIDEVFSQTNTQTVPTKTEELPINILVSAAGLPPLPLPTDNTHTPQDNTKKTISISEAITAIGNLFQNNNNKNISSMKKDFTCLNTLLSVNQIEFVNEKASLTDEQITTINQALSEAATAATEKEKIQKELLALQAEKEELTAQKAALQEEIKTLQNTPGGETNPVSRKTDNPQNDDTRDYVTAARNLFNAIPD